MGKYISLQIPTSCHESWDGMTTNTKGKFCNNCEKTVIDFTEMSNTQLANFFIKNKEKVCGRFNSEQLHTEYAIPKRTIPWLKYFFTITLPAFLFSQKSNGQNNIKNEKVVFVEKERIETDIENKNFSDRILKGKVIDDKGNPVSYASIMITNTRFGTISDEMGKFNLTIKGNKNSITISAVGYQTKRVFINEINTSDIILTTLESQLLGDVITIVRHTKKKKNTQHKIKIVEINNINIDPNPISANAKLNISWKNFVINNQQIEIYNTHGALIQKEVIEIFAKTNSGFIILQQMPSGFYIIKITDTKTKQIQSKEFIIN
jgi:CarboxypepD_reg-like domain/Secretion system C-terminal sorting domain